MERTLTLSALPKTWLIDLDGTIFVHNGHLTEEGDILVPGVQMFLKQIPDHDLIVILTAREEKYREITEEALLKNTVRYNTILFNVPKGERILINDKKPNGLRTAHAVDIERNDFPNIVIYIDENL